MHHYQLMIPQLMPNGMRIFLGELGGPQPQLDVPEVETAGKELRKPPPKVKNVKPLEGLHRNPIRNYSQGRGRRKRLQRWQRQLRQPSPLKLSNLHRSLTLNHSPSFRMCRSNPLSKKQRVDEKSKRKALAKRKEPAKAIVPESNVEPQLTEEEEVNVEVNLPRGTSLFQNKKLSVQIMHQLLTDVDTDTGMGLIYHSTDKVVEQREQIKELEEIDRECGEKLLDIE
ncbi:hypothetical protein TIFTF001_020400 [Ficus carica]|uniref:Uncharacterized protein n=1 Tax=Ficus carica TaxID=3494 RepID=A0AA88AIC8_FICCA|nr:hypothetical protein TIFTF001_020400 [Ficus carica]